MEKLYQDSDFIFFESGSLYLCDKPCEELKTVAPAEFIDWVGADSGESCQVALSELKRLCSEPGAVEALSHFAEQGFGRVRVFLDHLKAWDGACEKI